MQFHDYFQRLPFGHFVRAYQRCDVKYVTSNSSSSVWNDVSHPVGLGIPGGAIKEKLQKEEMMIAMTVENEMLITFWIWTCWMILVAQHNDMVIPKEKLQRVNVFEDMVNYQGKHRYRLRIWLSRKFKS